MRIYEKSSGGIVYRKTDSTIEILLLERKNSKNEIDYVLPKGHMEADETAKQTALREINEETGLEIADLEIIQFLCKTNYSFVASHQEWSPLIDKDVYLFLVQYHGSTDPVAYGLDIADEESGEKFSGISWKNLDEMAKIRMKPDVNGLLRKHIPHL